METVYIRENGKRGFETISKYYGVERMGSKMEFK